MPAVSSRPNWATTASAIGSLALAARFMHSSGLRELSSGVDALYLSGHGDPTPELVEDLARSRELCEMVHGPLAFNLEGGRFQIHPHGWGRYHYLLAGEWARIGISTSKHRRML
jgi:hypothetical protein